VAETGQGKPPLDARMLLLPMRGETDAVDRILGCLATNGPLGLTPRRFAITARRLTPVTPPDPSHWPAGQGIALAARLQDGAKGEPPRHPSALPRDGMRQPDPRPGLQEAAASFVAAPGQPPRLRLIAPASPGSRDSD
jgi:hypothetical protein